MNLSDLTKEKKQYLILGLIGAVAILAAIGIGIHFSLSSLAASKNELAELTDKIDRAERTLVGADRTMDGLDETTVRLKNNLEFIPPEQNYYSWATEIIYSKGRNAGLEIESVDELRVSGGKNAISKDPVYFETYSLRITARGGYAQTKTFLQDLEANLPLVRVSGLEVSKSNNPEQHDMQLFIQWPFRLNRISKLWKNQPMREKAMVVMAKPAVAPVKSATPVVVAKSALLEKPTPVVVQAKPVPVSKPVPVRPVPVVERPAPVVVQAKPVPVSKPVPVKPVPVVEKPTPVVVQAKPVPVSKPVPVRPVPVVERPAPVVVQAKPVPVSKPVLVKPVPVVERPAPVVVQAKPVPVTRPAPVKPAPVVEKPAPVVVQAKPAPAEAEEVNQQESMLASIDQLEELSEHETPVPEVLKEENEMDALLASLGSRGSDSLEPVPVDRPMEVQDDLATYVQMLEESAPVQTKPQPAMVEVAVSSDSSVVDGSVQYVSSSKSEKILEEILTKGKPKASASLGSFLDGLVEDINDKR